MRRTYFILSIASIAFLAAALWLYMGLKKPVVSSSCNPCEFFVPTGTPADSVRSMLLRNAWIQHPEALEWAEQLRKIKKAHPGRYVFEAGATALEVVSILRSGLQEPVRLTFKAPRQMDELAGIIGKAIEADSASLYRSWKQWGDEMHPGIPQGALSFLIPNTYEMYWNTSAADFKKRMEREYQKWWNTERAQLAAKLGLTPFQVATLAAVVEKETQRVEEMPVVAGLYLNRLKKGIRLQADPTVIYARQLEQPGIEIKRVLLKDLKVESPYNTYLNTGLPPGPICLPSIQALEAVLRPVDHTYLYMCANPDKPGYHAFASTLVEHERNRRKYVNWLNKNQVMR